MPRHHMDQHAADLRPPLDHLQVGLAQACNLTLVVAASAILLYRIYWHCAPRCQLPCHLPEIQSLARNFVHRGMQQVDADLQRCEHEVG